MLTDRPRIRRFLTSAGLIVASGFLVALPVAVQAQNRVDLDDLTIKGELLNDNRLRMSSRDQHQITDRVSYRDGFRKEIIDGLEIPWPEQDRTPASGGR